MPGSGEGVGMEGSVGEGLCWEGADGEGWEGGGRSVFNNASYKKK